MHLSSGFLLLEGFSFSAGMDKGCNAKHVGSLVRELLAQQRVSDLDSVQKTARVLVQNGITKLADVGCVDIHDLQQVRTLPESCVKLIQMNIVFETNKFKVGANTCGDFTKKRRLQIENVQNLGCGQTILNILQGMQLCTIDQQPAGPLAASMAVAGGFTSVFEQRLWAEHARLESLCSSTRKSIGGTRSALNCWLQFAKNCLGVPDGQELPPSLDGLIVWGRMFRNKPTFENYCSRLSLVCQIAGVSTAVFGGPALARVKRGIGAIAAAPRPRKFIGRDLVQKLMCLAMQEKDHIQAMLYCLSYAFLLRVPSECLPVVFGGVRSGAATKPLRVGQHSCLTVNDSALTLQLACRKNRQHGSVLVRKCWCASCKITCPVHMCLKYLADPVFMNQSPFKHLSPNVVTTELRRRLHKLSVCHADDYRSHDFRRGHARDLQRNGARLAEILQAGEWSSPAFLKYLDLNELESSVVVEAHVNESEEE